MEVPVGCRGPVGERSMRQRVRVNARQGDALRGGVGVGERGAIDARKK